MHRNSKWNYERQTKSYLITLRLTQSERDQLRHVLQTREIELYQLVRECMTHYLACPNHSPEIQSVIDAARELYPG